MKFTIKTLEAFLPLLKRRQIFPVVLNFLKQGGFQGALVRIKYAHDQVFSLGLGFLLLTGTLLAKEESSPRCHR